MMPFSLLTRYLPFFCMLSLTALDQAIKHWAMETLKLGQPMPMIPTIAQFQLTYNTGGPFSMMAEHPQWVINFGILALSSLVLLFLYQVNQGSPLRWSLAIIVGGAIGNLMDRLTFGAVVDYIDLLFIQYPVFNLADMCITLGLVAWMIQHLKLSARSASNPSV